MKTLRNSVETVESSCKLPCTATVTAETSDAGEGANSERGWQL